MKNFKVLIVTYYWPPAGGPGVQRWLKFSKYLPEFGIEPIIYTPENPSYPILDESLVEEVSEDLIILRKPIWEPYQIAEKINPTNRKFKAGQFGSSKKKGVLSKLSIFIRGNFFIPDARKFWVKPSVKFLRSYLKEEEISTLITTGPPHSMHLIGLKLKKKNPNLNWIADFRDPWTQISYHSELSMTRSAQSKHQKLEKAVISSADLVLATSFSDAENFAKLGAKRVEVITNGFEHTDFKVGKILSSKFKITYSGGLEEARNPILVWKALQNLVSNNAIFQSKLEIQFYGNLSQEVAESMESFGLTKYLVNKGYVSHHESVQGIKNADLLLLTNFPQEKSKGIIPGKLFEYLATGNPILSFGPKDADVQKILMESKAGKHFYPEQLQEVEAYILHCFDNFENSILNPVSEETLHYSRKNLTEKLANLLKDLG